MEKSNDIEKDDDVEKQNQKSKQRTMADYMSAEDVKRLEADTQRLRKLEEAKLRQERLGEWWRQQLEEVSGIVVDRSARASFWNSV